MTDTDEFTADAITHRIRPRGDGCVLCGIEPDRDCYMPAKRCPRAGEKTSTE